jgi:uncharacterized protein
MQPYRIDLSAIREVTGGEMHVSDAVELPPLTVGDETFTFTRPVEFDVTLTNTSAGIVASGEVRATATTECSRCLEDFEMALTGEIQGFYVPGGRQEGIPAEQAVEPVSEGRIDLMPAILTALAVEAPFAPVHAEDCKGICPVCGVDRNVQECGCEAQRAPSPFDKLSGMFPDSEG